MEDQGYNRLQNIRKTFRKIEADVAHANTLILKLLAHPDTNQEQLAEARRVFVHITQMHKDALAAIQKHPLCNRVLGGVRW